MSFVISIFLTDFSLDTLSLGPVTLFLAAQLRMVCLPAAFRGTGQLLRNRNKKVYSVPPLPVGFENT